MSLLYISPSVLPSKSANSVHVMRMCNAFSKNGIKVDLLCKASVKESDTINIFDYYGIPKSSFKITPLVQFHSNKLNSLKYGLRTLLYSLKTKCNNIYSRDQLCSVLILLFSNKIFFIELHSPPTGIYKLVFKLFVNTDRISKIILISDALKKIVIDKLKIQSEDKILVCHDGADEPSSINTKINFTKNNYDVGYVGHLYSGRGIETILNLAEINKEIKFHIIGGYETDINHWKTKINSDNIIFHGHVKPKLVSVFLNQFDLLIAPYQQKVIIPNGLNTASWMSPLKIFEYMAAKKPILSSNLPVLKEVLTHNVNSYLCDPNKLSDWDIGLKFLVLNPDFSDKIATNAYNSFKNFYTWSSRSKIISKYFE